MGVSWRGKAHSSSDTSPFPAPRTTPRLRPQERSLRGRVSEGVYLPGHPGQRLFPELFPQEGVAEVGLVHHAHVMRRGLVMHHPAPVDEGQPSLRHQVPHGRFFVAVLL